MNEFIRLYYYTLLHYEVTRRDDVDIATVVTSAHQLYQWREITLDPLV